MKSNIIFIFSLPRSGSTLLQRLLSGHTDIDSTSEGWFLLPLIYPLKRDGVYAQYSHLSVHRAVIDLAEQMPGGVSDYYKAVRKCAESIYAKLNPKRSKYFIDKTPRYYFIIKEISEIFPDAKFLFLFRNPLSIYSSLIDSFYKGRLGLLSHSIDVFEGPFRLAEGYWHLRDRALRVQYEDLLYNPENALRGICQYLDIKYSPKLIEGFNDVVLKGRMGDASGSMMYKTINRAPVEKWKTTLGTRFRRNHGIRYIEFLGSDILEVFGVDRCRLLSELGGLKVAYKGEFSDRWDLMISAIKRFIELPLMRKKLQKIRSHHKKIFIHI